MSRAIGAILDRQIVVDPRVKGQITLYSEQPLAPREAYLNYLAALRGLGFTVVEVAGLLKVVPEADAKLQTGTVSVGNVNRTGDQIITQIFRLNHENAANLVAVLRPLISPNNTINANPGNNTLVITDYADNLQRIAKVVATMDVPGNTDVEVIPLKHAIATDLAAAVQKLSDPSAATGAAPAAAASASVIADPRINALLVRAANPARLAQIRSLVAKLDQPGIGGAGGSNIYVVYLKNADATRLAQVMRAAYLNNAPGTQGSTPGGAGSGGSAFPTSNNAASNFAQQTSQFGGGGSSTGASPQATAPISASASVQTGGFIQADPATNSLIITGPEPLYRQLRSVIDQLDSRRAQVYIESLIVEVSGDNAADFGFQWLGASGREGDRNIPFAASNLPSTGGTGGIIGINAAAATDIASVAGQIGSGFSVGLVRNFGGQYALAAIARALQSQTKTNILSTPNLVTLDNEEAKIIVGSNVPFVTGQFTSTGTGTTNPFQTIERKDVGITLRIKPTIGEGGTVKMTIYQESSSLADSVAPGTTNAGPTTNKRSIESNVLVDDGQVIVLGGLVQDRYTENNSKVPLLGDIPVLGALFRSESRKKERTNLMVFLRPVVMRDADATNRLSLDRYDLIRSQQQSAQPAPRVLLPINESPVLPQIRPEAVGPGGTPPPLGDSTPLPAPVAPSVAPPPAPAPAPAQPPATN
ncbi:type II secretion system secretin GspD [Methylibium sp.]|uniref:type II secretion system secretin GspD n=1 Tax=Methylibium sp. TaxID=2067992 RepID=UPI0039C958FE